MFEDALFATNRRRSPQQRWAAITSILLQAGFVTFIVALPLFFTEALPLNLGRITELPSVPRSAGPPPTQPTPTHASPRTATSELVNERLIFVRVPTGRAKSITDNAPPEPACVGLCVPGSTGPGTGGDNPLDRILGEPISHATVLPKPPAPKITKVSHMDEGLLVHKVTPVYPQLAVTARQQGTVLLHAIIGRDGTIQNLQAVSGPPLLIKAAIDAVSQWRYRPYVLNGEPVEVDTQITVNFKLGG